MYNRDLYKYSETFVEVVRGKAVRFQPQESLQDKEHLFVLDVFSFFVLLKREKKERLMRKLPLIAVIK